jgi:hypothetical protein
MQLDLPLVIVAEQCADLRHVVQRQHELAFDLSQPFFQLHEIGFAEVEAVKLAAPIRRIQIEKRLGTVVPAQDLFVGQVLDLDIPKSLVSVFDELRKIFRIEVRWPRDAVVVIAVHDKPPEGVLLEVEEPCRTLNISEAIGILLLEVIEPIAARENVFQITQEFLVMRLTDPKEVDDFSEAVIQDLDRRRIFMEENLCASGEWLDVSRVLWKDLDDLVCYSVFSADVWKRANHVMRICVSTFDRKRSEVCCSKRQVSLTMVGRR